MISISSLLVVLGVAWLISIRWMNSGKHGIKAHWIDTIEGGVWVQTKTLPNEGERVRVLGYLGSKQEPFDPERCLWGTLARQKGVFTWYSSGKRSYLPRH